VRPEYSARAKFQRIQGTVVLETIIGTDGLIESSRVVQGLRGYTVQAIRAARQWRFEPATFEGRPVPVYFTLTGNFALN
jgi:protein TonB